VDFISIKGKKGKEKNSNPTLKSKIQHLLPVERKRKKNKSVSILASRIEPLLFYTIKGKKGKEKNSNPTLKSKTQHLLPVERFFFTTKRETHSL